MEVAALEDERAAASGLLQADQSWRRAAPRPAPLSSLGVACHALLRTAPAGQPASAAAHKVDGERGAPATGQLAHATPTAACPTVWRCLDADHEADCTRCAAGALRARVSLSLAPRARAR